MALDYVALGLMLFAMIVIFYLIIAIHDIPYEIAKKRDHPHLEAIHYAGWISMFTLHVIWPFLWIWATIYHRDRGYGFGSTTVATQAVSAGNLTTLVDRLSRIEARIDSLEADAEQSPPSQPDSVTEE